MIKLQYVFALNYRCHFQLQMLLTVLTIGQEDYVSVVQERIITYYYTDGFPHSYKY